MEEHPGKLFSACCIEPSPILPTVWITSKNHVILYLRSWLFTKLSISFPRSTADNTNILSVCLPLCIFKHLSTTLPPTIMVHENKGNDFKKHISFTNYRLMFDYITIPYLPSWRFSIHPTPSDDLFIHPVQLMILVGLHSLKLTVCTCQVAPSQQETIVFQPSIFRCFCC